MHVPTKGEAEIRLWDPATRKPDRTTTASPRLDRVRRTEPRRQDPYHGRLSTTERKQGEVRFWDRATLAPQGQPLLHDRGVYSAAFSPDGRMIVDRQLWTTHTKKGKRRSGRWRPANGWDRLSRSQAGVIWHVSFSPDGRTILTGGTNQPCTLWELPTDRLIGPMLVHQDRVSAVAFSPDGKMVDRGHRRTSRQGARAALGNRHRQTHRPAVATARPRDWPWPSAATGAGILTGTCNAPDRGEAQIWDAATGKPLGRPVTHPNDIVAVAFSPDGRRIVTGAWTKPSVCGMPPADNRSVSALVHPVPVACLVFSPDGALILTGAGTASPALGRQPPESPAALLWSIRGRSGVSPSAPAGKLSPRPVGQLLLWHTATVKPLGLPFEHVEAVNGAAFSPDGKLLVTGCPDGMVRVWDSPHGLAARGEPAAPQGRQHRARSVPTARPS